GHRAARALRPGRRAGLGPPGGRGAGGERHRRPHGDPGPPRRGGGPPAGRMGDPTGMTGAGPFAPPTYPYEPLVHLRPVAVAFDGGAADRAAGARPDPRPPSAADVLARSDTERGYPASIGSPAYRTAAAGWLRRRLGAEVAPEHVAACIGTKELVAGLPHWL